MLFGTGARARRAPDRGSRPRTSVSEAVRGRAWRRARVQRRRSPALPPRTAAGGRDRARETGAACAASRPGPRAARPVHGFGAGGAQSGGTRAGPPARRAWSEPPVVRQRGRRGRPRVPVPSVAAGAAGAGEAVCEAEADIAISSVVSAGGVNAREVEASAGGTDGPDDGSVTGCAPTCAGGLSCAVRGRHRHNRWYGSRGRRGRRRGRRRHDGPAGKQSHWIDVVAGRRANTNAEMDIRRRPFHLAARPGSSDLRRFADNVALDGGDLPEVRERNSVSGPSESYTVRPCVGTVPAKETVPAAGASTASPASGLDVDATVLAGRVGVRSRARRDARRDRRPATSTQRQQERV